MARTSLLVSLVALVLTSLPTSAAQHAPYIPDSNSSILEHVPSITDPRVRHFEQLAARLRKQPHNRELAVELAKAYIDYARGTGDARYLGRALALLEPWLAQKPPPVDVMIVHATILQSRHQFDAARKELKTTLRRAPDNAQGWLTLSTVDMVQGRIDDARKDCVHAANTGGPYVAVLCTAELLSLTGHAEQAYRLLGTIVGGGSRIPMDIQAYVQGLLAEVAARIGKTKEADQHYRQALQDAPGDNFLLADYGDFLLAEARPRDALDLVSNYQASDTSFLRMVMAENALGLPQATADIQTMAERFAALDARGSYLYRREQAAFVLELLHQPEQALRLAQENWQVQRAPKDVLVFLQAALAAGQPQAARPVIAFLDHTHLSDPRIDPLAARVRKALGANVQASHTLRSQP